MDLNAKVGDINSDIGTEGFRDWRKQCSPRLPIPITGRIGHVNGHSIGQRNGTCGKNIRLHRAQHAPHIRVIQNCSRCVFNGAFALLSVFGIGQCMLIGPLCAPNALTSYTETGVVHHGKHGTHPIMRLTDQPPRGPIILHDSGRAAVKTHFMFKAHNL